MQQLRITTDRAAQKAHHYRLGRDEGLFDKVLYSRAAPELTVKERAIRAFIASGRQGGQREWVAGYCDAATKN